MSVMEKYNVGDIYQHFWTRADLKYNEEEHCKLLIKVMMDRDSGCHSAFCVKAMIAETTFYRWVRTHELFGNIYNFCKMLAKQYWFEEGRRIRDKEYQMGTISFEMEHWKLMGWCKFGISRNSRIKINIEGTDSPAKLYEAILIQAAEGDFTASEFKQLMEAVNVGLNVHQVFELQKQIDELKSDLKIVTANTNVENPFSNKGTAKTD